MRAVETLARRGPDRRRRAGVPMLLAAVLLAGSAAELTAQATPPAVVRPGAPGLPSRPVSAEELRAPARSLHTAADLAFMRDMVVHHRQALVMSALAPDRTQRRDVLQLAERIARSQDSEIAFMTRWLELRGAAPPSADAAHAHHAHPGRPGDGAPGATAMAGMLTEAQLESLSAARGTDFDRLFLHFMIHHHEGALTMVDALFAAPGAGLDSDVFGLASHVIADQRMEIARMRAMLGGVGVAR
jgi:uncharacterized protein (DUF305 family)